MRRGLAIGIRRETRIQQHRACRARQRRTSSPLTRTPTPALHPLQVVLLNDNVQASSAVGEAIAGLVNVGVSNDGGVLIGDYDNSDATQNEVVAKVRGRGEAQGGMINIGG